MQIYFVIVLFHSNKKHDKWTYHVFVISFFRLAPFFYLKNNPKNDNLSLNCTFFNYHNCTSIIFSGTQIFLPKKSIASPPKNHYIEQKLPSPRLPCFQKNIWALFQYLASNGAPDYFKITGHLCWKFYSVIIVYVFYETRQNKANNIYLFLQFIV